MEIKGKESKDESNLIIKGSQTTAKVMLDDIDETTYSQIQTFVNNPNFKDAKVRIMPDTHAGKGSVIGFTMPVGKRVCPNIVGVDIGCGMLSVNIGNKLNLSLEEMDKRIRSVIPLGFNSKDEISVFVTTPDEALETIKRVGLDEDKVMKQIGTLGGGNHFIEIGKDETGNYWLTIHTGSRNFGKVICEYWQKKAIEYDVNAESKDLAHLSEEDTKLYLQDMKVAQEYASSNRLDIFAYISVVLEIDDGELFSEIIESVHNFIDFDDNIIRKGAIRSYEGEQMVIPFNMRDGLLICEGKSNEDWNCSAPHGAGRVYSRNKAKAELSLEEFESTMKDAGVFSTSISKSTLDESPMAYKDAKIIEDAIAPTANIIHRVKPILNIKA